MDHPILYQINTRCWLRELSDAGGRPVTLATVPAEEFDRWQKLGFSHVWLMGVWTTGPRARRLAVEEPNLRHVYDQLVPDWTEDDVGGSPYSIAAYEVPAAQGGNDGLRRFQEELHRRGMKLILDFVPNHVGFDHPWVAERPELFVQSPVQVEGTFAQETARGPLWIAHGKDPHFFHWTDVAQVDYRKAVARQAMHDLLLSIADLCDGVRCDMAMLILNDVFARTWAHMPDSGPAIETEFWADSIQSVKQRHPEFIFIAEVYWGLEGRLQWLGFDYTYDKALYDDLHWRSTSWTQKRLLESAPEYVAASVHFLENHDENRVAATLSLEEHKAALLLILGLPGMRFLHDGQLTGAQMKIPVQLCRRPLEPVNKAIAALYETMLTVLKESAVGRGQVRMLTPHAAWPNNPTGQNFVILLWQKETSLFDLVVVNLAPHRSQCYATLPADAVGVDAWHLQDVLGGETYEREGAVLADMGLYLDIESHCAQLLRFTRLEKNADDQTTGTIADSASGNLNP